MVIYKNFEEKIPYSKFREWLLRDCKDVVVLNEKIKSGILFNVKLDLGNWATLEANETEVFEYLGMKDFYTNDEIRSGNVNYHSGKFLFWKKEEPYLFVEYCKIIDCKEE